MKEKHKNKSQKKGSDNISLTTFRKTNIVCTALFYLLAFSLLAFYKNFFLYRMQELSIFLPTADFFQGFLTKPGGVLMYVSAFFLQFAYYPALGALLIVALLGLVQYLVFKSFQIPRKLFLCTLILPALLLLCITQLDYVIYLMPDREFVFSHILGVILILALFSVYRKLSSSALKLCYMLLAGIIFYPSAGFYACAALLLFVLYELIMNSSKLSVLLLSLTGLLALVLIPFVYYYAVFDIININFLYFYGLPIKNFFDANTMWIPIICSLAVIPVYLAFFKVSLSGLSDQLQIVFNVLTLCVALIVVFGFTYYEKNFHIQLEMEYAIGQRDFERVIEVAENTKDEVPTRAIIQYRNIALYRTGNLLDKMFTYPHGAADFHADNEISTTVISAYIIFYHYGRLNYSYRWAMESLVKRGPAVDYMKYMALTAVFNGETELAEKYLSTLEQTLFYKDWVRNTRELLYDHELFKEQDEYKSIYPLTLYNEEFWEETNNVEACNLEFYSEMKYGTKEMFTYSLAATLISKKIPAFMAKFSTFLAINEGKPMPVHIQEAALLFMDLEKKENPGIKFDQKIVNRYRTFTRLVNELGPEVTEKTALVYKERFGDTYWYYYFLMKNMKTN